MSITTCLWFQGDMEAALERYTTLFPDSEIITLQRMAPDAPPLLAEWRMLGTTFRAINERSDFGFTESISLSVTCADQAEVDRYWDGLIAGGGRESQCGWLVDAFGVSWQIVPARLTELLNDPDPARAAAAQQAMFGQRRLVIAELEAAADAAAAAATSDAALS
jgi:predicted 3-demethylubiquinone-9 3-methyltransferase (glyoxalase superfamily)